MQLRLTILAAAACLVLFQPAISLSQTSRVKLGIDAMFAGASTLQATNPSYLAQFPSPERIKADVSGVDAMQTAAKQASIFWQLRQLIYDLALSQRRTDRQFTSDEQRLEVEYRNARYRAVEPFGEPDYRNPKWFEVYTKYQNDLWLRDEVFKKYFTPDLRRAIYVSLKGQVPTENAPEDSRLTPTAGSSTAGSVSARMPGNSRPSELSAPTGGSVEAYMADAKKYYFAKEWAKAAEACEATIALNPRLSSAHYLLSFSYDALGRHQDAVTHAKEAVRLEPQQYTYHFMLGLIYVSSKEYEQALPSLQQSIALNADFAQSHYWLGQVYTNGFKQYEKAILEFREVLRLKPDDAFASRDLGAVYYLLGEYTQALELTERSLRIEPNNALALLNLGRTFLKMERKSEAMQVYRKLQPLDQKKAQELYAEINKLK